MRFSPYLLVMFCVATLAAGQLAFKFVSLQLAAKQNLLAQPLTMAVLGIALLLYGLSTVVWIIALKSLPLSRAYLLMSLGYVLVPLGAFFLYREPIGIRYLCGVFFITVGIAIAHSAP